MTLQILKTKAETAISENFASVAGKLPGGGWVPKARADAMAQFHALGLPHRRIEAWKYTDLRAGLKEALKPALPDKDAAGGAALNQALGPLAELDCIQLVFVNGQFRRAEMTASQAPGRSYEFETLARAIGDPAYDWMKLHFARPAPPDADAMSALNTAFMTDGAVLRIADGAALAVPIHLVFLADSTQPRSVTTSNLIKVGKGAKAVILESHIAAGGSARQANTATGLDIGDGAQVTHVKLLDEGAQSFHIGTWRTTIGANATYRAFQLTIGAGIARNQLFVTFAGEGSNADLSGAFLARGNGHIDTTLIADHAVPRCSSRELFKGVLDGRARGIFQGKLIVRPNAQKSDAKQMAQALLLSEDAEFDSKPELEIFADDVACGHGSTSGQIDEDLLFYLRARGIPAPQARAMLIQSFIGEALEKIEHEGIREAMMAKAVGWLQASEG